jgi:alpha/beta superfamily hydrolase
MNNKVVTTAAKAIFNLGIPVCRFNFRGVGRSSGSFAQGDAETLDFVQICRLWQAIFPQAQLLLSGFSFGSYVAYRAAQLLQPRGLLLIAPPVFRFDFQFEKGIERPNLILMGDKDEVVSPVDVKDFAESFNPAIPIEWFADTGHFFHGRLIALREAVENWVKQCQNPN